MKSNSGKGFAIILSAVALQVTLLSLPAHSQKDPQEVVVEQLDSDDIRSPNLGIVRIHSSGDVQLRNRTFGKGDGTTYFSNGSVSAPDGRGYLPSVFLYGKNDVETNLCKSEDCRKYREINFVESQNRKTRLRNARE